MKMLATRRVFDAGLLAACVAASVALLPGCEKKTEAVAEEIVRPVRVEPAKQSGGTVTRMFSGSAKAGTETRLSFKVGGTISTLKLKVGDKLRKGKTVASLESRDQGLQVQEAKAGVKQAEAQRRNARANYERVKALYENNNATQAELDSARTAYDSAREAVAGAKKRTDLAKSQAGKTRLRVPVDGVVAKVLVEEGENVQPGQSIAILNSGARAEVAIAVPEALIGRIEDGQAAEVSFDAVKGVRFAATVSEIGIAPDGTAGTYPVLVTLDEEDDRVKSGMAAEVKVRFGKKGEKKRLVVNPKAIGEDKEGRFAFVAVPGEPGFAKVERRSVKTGNIGSEGIEVLDGISVGELVVTAGLTYLQDGKRVRLPKKASAAAGKKKPKAKGSAAPPASAAPKGKKK